MGSTGTTEHLVMDTPWLSDSGKTKIWDIINTTLNEPIGTIRWHGAWRKYVFASHGPLLVDANCARQIARLLDEAMADYQVSKQASR
jgi:hypothetical protein